MINRERYNIISQINYAFEDMALRTKSAVRIDAASVFSLGSGAIVDTKNQLKFFGEQDIYKVTPDDQNDNMWYEYGVEGGSLILRTFGNAAHAAETVTLVEAKYQPVVTFSWYQGYEPNFITVTITAKGTIAPSIEVSRTQGLRFWFIDVKK